jgi:hypothetical protein
MAIRLIQKSDGTYEYVDAASTTNTNSNLSAINTQLEAYEGTTDKSVVDTSVASQTQKVMRETPGQYTTNFNPDTGQFETKSISSGREEIAFQEPERTPESTDQTALQKVMSISSTTGSRQDDGLAKAYKLIEDQQKLAKRAQLTNNLFRGADFALNTYRTIRGDSVLNIANQSNVITPITQLTKTPIGSSTLGSVAGAAGLAYGVGSALKVKEKKGMAAGAAIGMTLGGPIGAVAGSVIGGVAESVIGGVADVAGSVICTELNRQGLISNQDYKIHWDYTINKWDKDELKGYWIWAIPTAKKMKTNKLLTKFWHHIMKYKIQYVKYTLGKDKFTLRGLLYNTLIEQVSLGISKLIKNKKNKEVLV